MDLNRIFMKNCCPTKVGGQAILEGLMMRGSRSVAVAIRQPDGNIHLAVEPLSASGKWKKYPVLRGVYSFVSSLVMGVSILMYGADVLERLEEEAAGENTAETESPAPEKKVGQPEAEPAKAAKKQEKD